MLSYQGGNLCLEGKSIQTLAEELGTPFFLLSEARLKANYNALARGLSHSTAEATIRYCAKANNEAGVMALLAAWGSHVLVSHPAEARLALRCGFSPEKTTYQRPFLVEDEVREVLDSGISFFYVYRLQDLPTIEKVASEYGQTVKISLRLRNDPLRSRFSPLNFLSRRLGLRESDILPAAERIRNSEWLNLAALNFHRGTQQESFRNYRTLIRRVTRLGARLQKQLGVSLEEINLGGGIPSPSLLGVGIRTLLPRLKDKQTLSGSPESLEEFSQGLAAQFRDEAQQAGLRPLSNLAVTPGRAIVGNAGILVTRVRAVHGKWVFLDTSRNHVGESLFLFTRKVLPVNQPGRGTKPMRYYHLAGCTPNTADIIDFRRRLPILAMGDIMVLCDAGAYSISRASRYAGMSPAVYLVKEDGSIQMIRRAENLSDLSSAMIEGA